MIERAHKNLLTGILIEVLLCWLAWILVVYKLDPYETTGLALTLFFISLTGALSGSFALVLFYIKKWRSESALSHKQVGISLRQGILLALCTGLCLGLLALGILRIWNGLLIVTLMMLLEFYLSAKDDLD